MSLTVKSISIENVKGIAKCELRLDGRSLIVIKGQNASGKTSILDAVRCMFESGGDPALIRHGAKAAKVEMILSDGVTVSKRVTSKGYELKAVGPDGVPIPGGPREYVKSLADSFAFDPLAFCRADKKKRVEFLIEAMPITFSGPELASAVGGGALPSPLPCDLDNFDRFRLGFYERRKAANSAVKELDLTVTNLKRSLPAGTQGGEKVNLAATIKNHTEMKAAVEKDEAEAIAAVVQEANAAREQAQKDYDDAVRAAQATKDQMMAGIHRAEQEACDEARDSRKAEKDRLAAVIAEAQSHLSREGEIRALANHLAEQEKRQGEKATEALALDRALTALDTLRKSKLDALPIPGMEIRDGEVFYGGVPFDELNQAQQYVRSIEIGCLRLGDLPLVISDEAEHLDSAQWKEFCESVEGSGLQVIVARVDDGALRAEPQGSLIS